MEEVEEYIRALEHILANPSMALFVDETAKDRNAARRRRHWSKQCQTPIEREFFIGDNQRKRYSMLSACDMNGFILAACEIVERE
jgi:hypothetical protein